MQKLIPLFSSLLLLSFPVFGQSSLQSAINSLADYAPMKPGLLSVTVMDVNSGKLIAGQNEHKALIPASSLKTVTTATAIGLLGAGYQFKTDLEYDGSVDPSGILHGNIYIKGYGDPTLGSDRLEECLSLNDLLYNWQQAILKQAIKKVDGHVIGDASWFDSQVNGHTWQWADLGNYYASGAWGLNIHENLYYLHFQQRSKIGTIPPVHTVSPEVPGIQFVNEVRSAGRGTGDNAYIYGAPYSNLRYIRGTIPVGNILFKIKGSLPSPPYFAAYHLNRMLKDCGIEVEKPPLSDQDITSGGSKPRAQILTIQSPPLSQLIKEANHESVNLYCESFLKTIGKIAKDKGSFKAGTQAVYEFWKDRGVDLTGFNMEDGSGLSARNAISSYQLASILRKAYLDPNISTPFYESLPRVGMEGTVKNLLKGRTDIKGKIRAKSGSISRVITYTGYVETASGRMVSFSIMANNYTGKTSLIRSKIARIMLAIYQL